MQAIAEQTGVASADILSHDLYLYNAEEGKVVGINDELILSPRIDDLGCVYASLRAFLDAPAGEDSVNVLAVFDNEEVGSETKQGASSTFLDMTLRAIAGSDEKYSAMLYHSFMVSADNAHALHPNHPELHDPTSHPTLNGGVVVKINAQQKYMTDGNSSAVLQGLCQKAGVECQMFVNRSDMAGGSTLGNVVTSQLDIHGVDVGTPLLAMHSLRETAGVNDMLDTLLLFDTFFQ
jgi:aspartyl aminopeptidase